MTVCGPTDCIPSSVKILPRNPKMALHYESISGGIRIKEHDDIADKGNTNGKWEDFFFEQWEDMLKAEDQ
ncbi:MAG: hypothetical protein AAB489_00895 [Patescibacteria group bacterium]